MHAYKKICARIWEYRLLPASCQFWTSFCVELCGVCAPLLSPFFLFLMPEAPQARIIVLPLPQLKHLSLACMQKCLNPVLGMGAEGESGVLDFTLG